MVMARWKNGVPITRDEGISVMMEYFNVSRADAELYLFCISKEGLQDAVNYIENRRYDNG